jgi:hypothetical protein
MYKLIFAAALAALVVSSCRQNDPPMTRSEFCQSYAERECNNVAPACLITESACTTVRQAWCTAWGQGEEDAVPPRSFDPQNADACLSRVSAVFGALNSNLAIQPNDYRSIAESCARVFHGNAPANDTCGVDADCSGSLICDKGHCGTSQQVDPNAGCANIGESCPQGYYCGAETGVSVCTVRPGLGAFCSASVPCLEDLRCDETGVCAARLPFGTVCQSDGDCASRFCEPFALKCGQDVRFADGSPACLAYQ